MILSEDRQSHFVHVIVHGLEKADFVEYRDESLAIRCGKRGMQSFMKEIAAVDQYARNRVASLKRGVLEGTPEWDVLYNKYLEEEMLRRGKG